MVVRRRNTVQSILDRVQSLPVEATGCRLWPHVKDADGYGTISLASRTTKVHRLVLQAALGRDLAANEHACHTCDTPSCVEASHLWAGTNRENMADRDAKGRARILSGEQSPHARLTEAQVREIRERFAAGHRNGQLAVDFGIAPSHVTSITKRHAWKHVA